MFYFKKILIILLIVFLFLPVLQMNFKFIKIPPLKGFFTPETNIKFNEKTWFSEDFQRSYDKFFNSHLGLRNFFVRFNNQLRFSLFNKVNIKNVILGKEGYTLAEGYIKGTYIGSDFLGEKKIIDYLTQVKGFQNRLKKEHDIDLILLYAPSKEFIIPEFFPERYQNLKRSTTNIEFFSEKSKELKLNYIDFNEFFRTLKDTSRLPTFYKQGEHWTYATMCLSAKLLVKYIENLRGIDMPDITFNGFVKSDTTRYFDYDQGDAMNLLFKIPQGEVYYPEILIDTVGKVKPRVLGIADCYYSQIYNTDIANNCFYKGGDIWFYYEQTEPKNGKIKKLVEVNKREELLKQDVIVILHTNHTLNQFGFGFFEDLEALLDPDKSDAIAKKDKLYEEEIKKIIVRIKNDKEWYSNVVKMAEGRNISINYMLRKSAVFVIKRRNK